MTPLMTNDTVVVLLPRGGIFHANCHEAASHTPDYERLSRDFHANQSGGGLRP